MAIGANPELNSALARLREFARQRPFVERCEMCSRELLPGHEHLVEPRSHRILCACDGCAILFDGRQDAKYKRVPHTVQFLRGFHLTDSQWDGLMIPIEMAFFFKSEPLGRVVALYPSPAGAVESQLSFDTWADVVRENPVLEELDSDTMALLVNRIGTAKTAEPGEYFIVPIDECYRLVGLIRTHWRGFAGGTEVWQEINGFFDELRKRSLVLGESANA